MKAAWRFPDAVGSAPFPEDLNTTTRQKPASPAAPRSVSAQSTVL